MFKEVSAIHVIPKAYNLNEVMESIDVTSSTTVDGGLDLSLAPWIQEDIYEERYHIAMISPNENPKVAYLCKDVLFPKAYINRLLKQVSDCDQVVPIHYW
mgnify:CR=1 FL=1